MIEPFIVVLRQRSRSGTGPGTVGRCETAIKLRLAPAVIVLLLLILPAAVAAAELSNAVHLDADAVGRGDRALVDDATEERAVESKSRCRRRRCR